MRRLPLMVAVLSVILTAGCHDRRA
ncbi:type VI secretion protein, partial [Citrobacter sp. wls619]